MPGNEVGDRVHNFFDQDNLSQNQHHSQAVDGNWPLLSNNLWVGNQRQIGAPLISNSKSINVQHPDSERGHASQSSRVPHGLNFTQSTLRPEFAKSQSQNQQSNLNGYMHGQQVFQTRQNEANFLGVDTEPDRHNLTSRGLFILESQRGNGPEHQKKGPMRLEATESPVNFDFLGGQQQMSGQQPSMLQPLPRQQTGFGDMQLLQQQVILKQMQELQRQQQLQQQEARQQSPLNRISSMAKQTAANHSPALINGTPIHDGSNYAWSPELMAGNTNWLQRGASPVMQGSSNGLMFPPEQSQALRMMGLVPQQVDQSLYGFPVSSTRGTSSQYPHNQIDKPTMQQISASSNSFPGNQYAVFPDQVSMQDGTLVSRPGFQGKNLFAHAPGQGLNSGVDLENSQQVNTQQSNASMQEFRGRQEIAGTSETLQDKTVMQVAPSQSAVPLDPTEEKILFGTDDSIWDAFGRSTSMVTGGYNLLDGTDFPNAVSTMQSGSWSALMQSAVAETSSDVGLQEEWSGLTFPNSEPPTANHQPSAFHDSGKQQIVWADNNLQSATSLSSRPFPPSDDANMVTNYCGVPGFQQPGPKYSCEKSERFQSNSSHRSIQQSSEEGSKWLDCSPLQKPLAEGSQLYGHTAHSSDAELNGKSISGSWTHQQIVSSYTTGSQPCNKPNGLNFMENVSPRGVATLKISENENSLQLSQSNVHKRAMHEEMDHGAAAWKPDSVLNSNVELERVKSCIGIQQVNREDSNLSNVATKPNSSTTKGSQDTSQQLPNSHHLDYWKHVDSSMNSKGGEGLGKFQHNLNKGSQVLESSTNSSDKGAVGMHELDICDKKENSTDSYRSNFSHHASTGGLRENVWLDASEPRTVPGGKQKSSVQIGRKSSGSRKFQYHPMGNLDEDVEPYYGTKHVTTSQAMLQQGSLGLKSHDQGYFGQSKFVGHVHKTSMEMEKGRLTDSQGDTKALLDEVPSRGILPGYVPNMSAPFDRSGSNYAPNKTAQSSQNMLELLHKVDQSREHGTTHLSSSDRNPSSEMPEGETSDGSVGHLQRNQSSGSQGFGLQLAPPSQRLPVQTRASSSQTSQVANSLSSSLFTPEIRDKGHTWFAPAASLQSVPLSRETSQGEFRNNKSGIPGQAGNENSQYNVQGNFPAPFAGGFPYSISQVQNQHMTGVSGQATANLSVNMSSDRLAPHFKHIDDSRDRALTSQSAAASLPDTAGSAPHNNLPSPANTSQPSSANKSHVRVPTQQIPVLESVPVSEPSATSGMSQRGAFSSMLPNSWTNASTQQRLFGAQHPKAPSSLFDSNLQSNNNLGATSSAPQKGDGPDVQKGVDGTSESGACSVTQGFVCGEEQLVKESPWHQVSSENIDPAQNASSAQGKGSMVKHLSDASLYNSAATQKDIEAFGRSLKPDNNLRRNYSLLHQVQAMKSMETDPNNRGLKRFKGPDCGLDAQQLAPRVGQHLSHGFTTVVRDASVNRTAVPSGDSKMLSFSSEPGDHRDRNAFAQLGNTPPQDLLPFGRNDSPNESGSNNATFVRSENSQISPLMAPSWFDQYGTFKNEQMLSMYDARKTTTVKTVEQPFVVGKSSDTLHSHSQMEQVNAAADSSQVGVWQSSTLTSMASEHFSSPHLLPPAAIDQTLVVVRPKKRKSATSELLPWHKEVTLGSQRLQNISMAEVDWAQAANRLVEKIEDEAEMIEDGPPMLRPKRRLILTTQLMQQLLRPPPASVLSADASSNYESLACFVARLALGDACGLISCSGSDSLVPPESGNLLSEKLKTSERIGDQYFLKVMEDFIGRARNLENDLLRLDKRASILDLRLEWQDLEKFSVINRFAKFHGRGQSDGAETSSSSDATANAQKTFPQRYVTALPMPRNLPDRVQCLSL